MLGAPAYHPRALLSVWLYGFMTGVRWCRKLEAACRDQIPYLWLPGGSDLSPYLRRLQAIQECVAGAEGQVSDWYIDDARHTVSFKKRELERFTAEAGMQVVASYVEGGYDGDGVEQPGLHRLLPAAQSGERAFDVVLVYSLSRLCRRSEGLHVFLSLLRDSGVEVVSVSEGYTPSTLA